MPDLLLSTRQTEHWTRDERRVIDRAAKLLNQRGVKMLLVCASELCPDQRLRLAEGRRPGEVSLRCGHLDRLFPAKAGTEAARLVS